MNARIYVDFNELIENDLVLLSKSDLKLDFNGETIRLEDGMRISIYDDNGEGGLQDTPAQYKSYSEEQIDEWASNSERKDRQPHVKAKRWNFKVMDKKNAPKK